VLGALATSHKIGILVVAAVFIAFALASSFLFPKMRASFPGRRVGVFALLSILFTAGMLATIILLATEPKEEREAAGETAAVTTTTTATESAPTTTKAAPAAGDAAAGKTVFESSGCSSCHTLKAAGASGTVGPNLDEAKPPAELVVDRVTHGRGVMPSFQGQLSEKQIQDVAAFVSSSAGES
jgi:mono/diheme cytochrome c family protein